jgi:hypothetical protein
MNQRNVEALKALIDKAKDAESDDYPPCETDWLARCLASMGVLVPSALTELPFSAVDDNDKYESGGFTECPLCGDDLPRRRLAAGIAALERIAKGETR